MRVIVPMLELRQWLGFHPLHQQTQRGCVIVIHYSGEVQLVYPQEYSVFLFFQIYVDVYEVLYVDSAYFVGVLILRE